MTIEFRCPYCTAPIQVGDEAAGKLGRCPRCATRLTVPKPAEDDVVLLEEAESESPPPPPMSPEPVSVAPDLPGNVLGDLPNPTLAAPISPVARKVKRRSRSRSFGWLIPVLCGLLLFGGLGWYVGKDLMPQPLRGELIGEALEEAELSPVLVPVDHSPLPARQLQPLLESLQSEPIPLLSDLMQVQIRGDDKGLLISLHSGPKTGWYRIDPRSHPALADYAREHAAELDQPRQKTVNAAAAEFIDQYAQIQEGKAPESTVTAFRDRLALNALVKGLGYHVAATVGSRVYPCVAETDDGHLYFLLPRDLKQFEIAGRAHGDGPPLFPGKFTVHVRTGEPPAAEPASSAPMPEN